MSVVHVRRCSFQPVSYIFAVRSHFAPSLFLSLGLSLLWMTVALVCVYIYRVLGTKANLQPNIRFVLCGCRAKRNENTELTHCVSNENFYLGI